ncbi:thioesterase family protein [Limibacter armeniacum]|uniref:acyl-CoA thioesterase n=1 Tax=Limibacter armeniacum TaxID=466084 RepID=UPI002FE67F89
MSNQQTLDVRTSTIEIPVRGYHLDVFKHVNNARYLEFLEEARWAHFEKNDTMNTAMQRGFATVIAHYDISYKYPATIGQTLEVKTCFESIGKSSVVFRQQIFLKGTDKVVVDAKVTFVVIDLKTQRPVEIPEDLKDEFYK